LRKKRKGKKEELAEEKEPRSGSAKKESKKRKIDESQIRNGLDQGFVYYED
jgi:hypothetical protein